MLKDLAERQVNLGKGVKQQLKKEKTEKLGMGFSLSLIGYFEGETLNG